MNSPKHYRNFIVDLRLGVMTGWRIELTYTLSDKFLGVYEIQCVYPNTLQLLREGSEHPIWIPNPLSTPSTIENFGTEGNDYRIFLLDQGKTVYKLIATRNGENLNEHNTSRS